MKKWTCGGEKRTGCGGNASVVDKLERRVKGLEKKVEGLAKKKPRPLALPSKARRETQLGLPWKAPSTAKKPERK